MPPLYEKKRKITRKGRTQRLNSVVSSLIGPALRARGITLNRIITEWDSIAGDAATWCAPESIRFPPQQTNDGTLTVSVASGRGPEMQMMSEAIIARVNQVFGYGAVNRIAITQTTRTPQNIKKPPQQKPKPPADAAKKFHQTRKSISPNASDGLRKALDRLGKSLAGDSE